MATKKQEIRIEYPFAPNHVNLNTDGSLIKLVAMIAMLCDHCGKMLFPQYPILRIIGRIAFPLYAYSIAMGCVYTRNHLKYLKRIVFLGLIVQPIYAISMAHSSPMMFSVPFADNPLKAAWTFYINSWKKPSILFAFALAILIIWTIRNRQFILTAALLLFALQLQSKLDYGFKGIVLVLLFYLLCTKWWLSLPCVLSFMVWWGMQSGGYCLFGIKFSSQMFAICALPLVYLHTKSGIKLPKWLFYVFYPGHFLLIYALDKLVF